MCKNFRQSRYSGYFSIDAAFALVIVIAAYSSFAHLAAASASIADAQSREISSSLLALRFSSFVLEEASAGGLGTASYSSANEIDMAKLEGFDLNGVLASTGKEYAKISLKNAQGELFSASAGTAEGEVFCTGRLALLSGEIVRLEACLS